MRSPAAMTTATARAISSRPSLTSRDTGLAIGTSAIPNGGAHPPEPGHL